MVCVDHPDGRFVWIPRLDLESVASDVDCLYRLIFVHHYIQCFRASACCLGHQPLASSVVCIQNYIASRGESHCFQASMCLLAPYKPMYQLSCPQIIVTRITATAHRPHYSHVDPSPRLHTRYGVLLAGLSRFAIVSSQI